MNHLKDQRGVAFILELVLVAAVLAVAGVGVYTAMHRKPAPLPSVKATPAKLVSPSPSATPVASTQVDSTPYLTVKELGIKLPLTSEIRDLTYVYAPAGFSGAEGRLQFSTVSITPLSNGFCSPSHEPLGTYIVYASAQSDPSAGVFTGGVNGKFIYYTHTQYACGDTEQERAKVAALIDPLLTAVKKA